MRLLLPIFIFCAIISKAQVPGNALVLGGAGEYVGFGEVLKDVRTISFWIKPSLVIDSTNATELPILVRDPNGPSSFATGEFAIYFGKAGTIDAGRIVFSRATTTAAYAIHSDVNRWAKNRWYHIAAVIHPQNGLRLYINGILQQDTDPSTNPIYIRSEGTTGTLYLGKWGEVSPFGIEAAFEELRFYTTAQTQAQVQQVMCKIEPISNPSLKAYYKFNGVNANSILNSSGTISGQPGGLSASNFIKSNAPIGENSSYTYNIQPGSSLAISEQASLTIDSINTNALGAHLYVTNDFALALTGSHPYFFGVWFTDTVAAYRAKLDFSSLNSICDSCSELSSRDYQTINKWNTRAAFPQNCAFALPQESPGAQSWREEYWIKPTLELQGGLDDTVSECEGSSITLFPTNYPGASYVWEDGSVNRVRTVDSTGVYWVRIRWKGCEVTDSVTVIREYMPYFELPNDTAICAGDTLVLEAPLDIDSATYVWGNGLHIGRTFRMYFEGTISLTITVGNCSWNDEITVGIIRPFQMSLGDDTTLCLGEAYVLEAPEGVDYTWSNGQSGRRLTVFNQDKVIWLRAWNSCFERVDTVRITYEECDCHFYVANAFTPNNDGVNDVFLPVSGCLFEQFQLEIYDRWGTLIFATNSMKEGWDGTYKGKNLPQGVFTFQLRYKKFSWQDQSEFQRGTINLIR